MNVTIVMSQFGGRFDQLEPGLSSYREYFPDAHFVLYTDHKDFAPDGVDEVRVVNSPWPMEHQRYGHRANDFYKIMGILNTKDGISIAIDTDTKVVSDDVHQLLTLVKKFGMCVPVNPRNLVRVDTLIGDDSDGILDETYGVAHAMNCTPIAVDMSSKPAIYLLKVYIKNQLTKRVRGPLALWRAIWETGFMPCLLPPQWCVCTAYCGCGDEIILHTGHPEVREHYGV